MARLFGTDGVRGIAGSKLTCDMALRIGQAAALCLTKDSAENKPVFLIGTDTRLSCGMLEHAVIAGLTSMGADVLRLGVVPTPAVSYLTGALKADASVVITASHNQYMHNGIKLFGTDGGKLSDEQQEAIEQALVADDFAPFYRQDTAIGAVREYPSGLQQYVEHLAATPTNDLSQLRIVFDCANGSGSAVIHALMQGLSLNGLVICANPDGTNINLKCGSTSPDELADAVVRHHAHMGIALDGDADRIVAADENGRLLDGDQLLAIFAQHYQQQGSLVGNAIVGTKVSNMGLARFCEERGITLHTADVGDRNVMACMLKHGLVLGGEQAGHIILRHHAGTGDGLLVGIALADIIAGSGMPLSVLGDLMKRYPQVTVNVKVGDVTKRSFQSHPDFLEVRRAAEQLLEGDGRILVRPSGTEALLRIMVEGKSDTLIERCAGMIAEVVERIDREAPGLVLQDG